MHVTVETIAILLRMYCHSPYFSDADDIDLNKLKNMKRVGLVRDESKGKLSVWNLTANGQAIACALYTTGDAMIRLCAAR